jgi:hypothetical protein
MIQQRSNVLHCTARPPGSLATLGMTVVEREKNCHPERSEGPGRFGGAAAKQFLNLGKRDPSYSSASNRFTSSFSASITSVFSTVGFLNARFNVNGRALSFNAKT